MTKFTGVVGALTGARRREADEFAVLLEGGRGPATEELDALVGLARALVPAQHRPPEEFRAALRDRLVAEAATRVPAVPAQRAPTAGRTAPPRWRTAVAAVAVASVVGGAGIAAASTNALPGDALYGLKLKIESVQLALAGSDLERGRELLEQAQSRLGEAERLAASSTAGQPETHRELADTLTEMQRVTDAGAASLTASYEDTGDQEPMLLLDRFVTDQQERLRDLLGLLDPSLRARLMAMSDSLDVMGSRAAAVVSSATGSPGQGHRDGWATTRLADRDDALPGTGSGSGGSVGETTQDAADGASTGSATDPLTELVTGLQGGNDSGSGSGSTGGGPSAGPSAEVDLGVGAVTATVPVPVPSALPPLPAPLPTELPLPTPDVTVSVPDLPEVLNTCVPVPPLTTC